MKVARALLLSAAMMAAAVVTAGCKSGSDASASPASSSDPSQPAVQTPGTSSPTGDGEAPTARRGRRHRRGQGDWQRKRRAASAPGSDSADPPAVPAQP